MQPLRPQACTACHRSLQSERAPSCFSTEDWPVVVLTLGPDPDRHQAGLCRIGQLVELLDRKEPFAMVIDARAEHIASREDPVRDWLKVHQERTSNLVTGTALLLSSSLGRFSMALMLLVLRRPRPYRVFEDLTEAKTWARATLPATSGQPRR